LSIYQNLGIANPDVGINGTQIKYEVVYEYEKVIGQKDGIPEVVYFSKSPYVMKKTVSHILTSDAEGIMAAYVDSYTKFLLTGETPYIESYNIGTAVRLEVGDVNECSITEVDYHDGVTIQALIIPTPPVEYESGNCSPTGYYQGVDGGPIGEAMFPHGFYAKTTSRKYISDKPIAKVGEFAGNGIVTNVDKSNPRWNASNLIYDITETITSLEGTPYS
jgi:hypothetical protein